MGAAIDYTNLDDERDQARSHAREHVAASPHRMYSVLVTRRIDMRGEEIRAMRTSLRLTQQDLADALDVDRSTISHFERGVLAPSPEMASRLRELLSGADVTPVGIAGVLRTGEVIFSSADELPPTVKLRVDAGSFPAGSDVIVRRGVPAEPGDWVLVGAPGRTTGWFGRLVRHGTDLAVERDAPGDEPGDLILIARGLEILGKAVRYSHEL